MFYINQSVDLNFSRPTHVKIYTVKGDTLTRQIKANVYDGSAMVSVESGGTQQFNQCIVMYQRPDGSFGQYDYDEGYDDALAVTTQPAPSGNSVWFLLRPEMVARAGTVKVWLYFNGGSSIAETNGLRTFPFEIEVADCPYFNPEEPDYDPLAPEPEE